MTKSIRGLPKWLAPGGESAVASVGLAVTAILITTLAACGTWLVRTQTHIDAQARHDKLRAVAELLASSGESLLTSGEVTALRRQLLEAAPQYGFTTCRVVTGDGDVIADAQADRISDDLDSATFDRVPAEARFETVHGEIRIHEPLSIDGRGHAVLEIAAPEHAGASRWEAYAGVAAVSAASLAALLLVYRHFRKRMAAIGLIREALIAAAQGQAAESALLVAENLGVEAAAWNHLLTEQQRLRRLAAVREVQQTAAPTGESDGDLANGCDAMAQGLIMIDDHLHVRYANNAAALFMHTTRDALVGRPIDECIEPKEAVAQIRQAVSQSRRVTHLVDRRKTGGSGVLRFSVRPVRRGDASTAMLVIEDVTQQRVAEEARHDFVAQATHELRQPLTNIRLYIETMIDDGDKDPALRAKCLDIINQESLRLERMVGDMLSVSEIEAGSLKIQRDDVRIDEMLRKMSRDFTALAEEKRIKLAFKLPPKLPVIQADREKIALAISNVVGNALKYTPNGGEVTVTADAVGGTLSIEVADTGIGVAPEDQPKVFEKFFRASDKRVTNVTGSGLGLALAREVVRLHGGDITLQSQIDVGSTFTITLPAAEQTVVGAAA